MVVYLNFLREGIEEDKNNYLFRCLFNLFEMTKTLNFFNKIKFKLAFQSFTKYTYFILIFGVDKGSFPNFFKQKKIVIFLA